MADEARPLSDEERAELEALRAEKAARERAELEVLRAARAAEPSAQAAPAPTARPAQPVAETEQDRRIREQRERGARLMEPDDDLRMPLGQKIVLGVLALIVLIIALMTWITTHG